MVTAHSTADAIVGHPATAFKTADLRPVFSTELGLLFDIDATDMLRAIADASVDLVFADPPFNLKKDYGEKAPDDRPDEAYVRWCFEWVDECVRILKPGGSLFLFNLPKWNIRIGAHLMQDFGTELDFRHDIAIEMKNRMPIPGRLYPAHYSLLYFTKGKAARFGRVRTPLVRCRHCGELACDYGGHASKMKAEGANLTDVWCDIPIVRHRRYSNAARGANALSTKVLERVLAVGSAPGDLVVDPFGGSGTTYHVAERLGRRWIGTDTEFAHAIETRLRTGLPVPHPNTDHVGAD